MKKFLLFTCGALTILVHAASGQTATTTPVGAVTILIKKNSETILSVPLATTVEFQGTVGSAVSAGTNLYNITPSGTATTWAANQFQNLYYVRFTSGTRSGMYYTITANSDSQVTIDTAGDNLSALSAGDSFKIYKHWTLNALFPYNDPAANPLTASPSTAPLQRKSLVMVYNSTAPGVNLTAGSSLYYFTSSGWLQAGTNSPANDTIFPPDVCFAVKQPGTVASDVDWTVVGSVATEPLAIPVPTRSSGGQEFRFGLMRPMDVPLSSSGFESGFVASPSTNGLQRKDQLYIFDNSVAGFNKSPSRIYYKIGTNWIKAVSGNPIANDDIIKVGEGIMIRKVQTIDGTDAILNNQPNYSVN